MDRIVAFDLETTGLEPESHRIVEFAFIVLDGELEELDRWHELVHPGIPIPADATEIHGIRDDDVTDARPFATVAPFVQSMLDDAVLMAYNHDFDRSFLHAELTRCGGPGILDEVAFIDPLIHFRRFVRDTPNTLEQAVAHYTGSPLNGAHRAIHDTEAMVDVFRCQIHEHAELGSSIEDFLVPHRAWLDPARKLFEGPGGQTCYGFGKHEGKPVAQHPKYAKWMLGADFDAETKRLLREALGSG